MAQLYKITPLEKKSVKYIVEVFKELDSGEVLSFEVTEYYRWGFGYRELNDPVVENDRDSASCEPSIGPGCELDDLDATFFEFSENFPEDEKEEIKRLWEEGDEEGIYGTGWLFNGGHEWQSEYDLVIILGPFKVDIIDDETGEIIEENVNLAPNPL